MAVTGARWGLEGAEAVLKLRALRANGDFPRYWHYHLAQERHRVALRQRRHPESGLTVTPGDLHPFYGAVWELQRGG